MYNKETLSFLPLRGIVLFPNNGIGIEVVRDKSKRAVREAHNSNGFLMVSTQKRIDMEDPSFEDVYEVGTVAKIQNMYRGYNGMLRVQIEGLYRAKILDFRDNGKMVEVDVEIIEDDNCIPNKETEALLRACRDKFEDWVKLNSKLPEEVMIGLNISADEPNSLTNVSMAHINSLIETKQDLLEIVDIRERLTKLYEVLTSELELMALENKIEEEATEKISNMNKEYFLREKMKSIVKELGEGEDIQELTVEYSEKLKSGDYPDYVVKAVTRDIKRFNRATPSTGEGYQLQNYIELALELPWNKQSELSTDIVEAKKILDANHYGMDKVKERIIEYISIKTLSPELNAPIICLVGPPGVGKTSVANSIAKALNRKFIRASLGGVGDEADIRGHRRTYIGAMPGRIIDGIHNVGVKDPVFLLDEVDKMTSAHKGDPVSALLEVLDPEQNNTFLDHYLNLPFDLSKVMWIVTANDASRIPRPLYDRMEVIELPSYTYMEKLHIVKEHLWDKVRLANGLKKSQVRINDLVIGDVISNYTMEAGVRELERQLSKICRRAAYKIVSENKKSISITKKNLVEFLGNPIYRDEKISKKPQVGVSNGLAWTEVGGTLLPVEVAIFKGKGNVSFTGQIGKVMQESGQAAMTYIRSRMDELHIKDKFYENKDIHVHFPAGGIPKDGPSAGITMSTAIVSALTGRKVRSDVAMTGEVTLRGRVLPIGGLKEKSMAAYREGIHNVIIPKDNERDLDDISQEVKEKINFIPVENMDDVLKYALEK